MSCCAHPPMKHVRYSASYRDEQGAIVLIKHYRICTGPGCRCESPSGLYPPKGRPETN